MNKTKKLTTGAMLLAIIGAAMIIDRQLSYAFTNFIVLLVPIVIATYSTMYKVSDGILLCVGLLAFTVLFGSLTTYIYMPISIIVGVAVSIAIAKGFDRRKINFVAIITYTVAEVLVVYAIMPLLGVSVSSQISSYIETFNQMIKNFHMEASVYSTIGNLNSLMAIILVASTVLVGILEGFLTSLLTAFILKRFNIKDIGLNSPLDIKMPVWLSYTLMALTCLFMFVSNGGIENETIKYIFLVVSVVASLILAYYGYFFVILYIKKMNIKVNVFLVILAIFFLFPLSYIILIVVGFLYGSGPLRKIFEN